MIGAAPKRPTGTTPEAMFAQWVWDKLNTPVRVQDVPNAKVLRTTRGTAVLPQATPTGGTGSGFPVWL